MYTDEQITTLIDSLSPQEQRKYLLKLRALDKDKQVRPLNYVDYSLYPKQTEVIELAVKRAVQKVGPKIIVIFGGNQSGKSESGGIVTSRVFNELPGARILSATVEEKTSINVQQRKLKQWLHDDQLEYGEYNPSRGWKNKIIIGKQNQHILIKTYAQGFFAFMGDEFDLVHLDEECGWDIFQECIMRTTKRNGCLLLTFTSLLGFTKIVNYLWQSDNPDVFTTVLDLFDNPYIPKENKDTIMATLDPDEVESRIHGKPHMKEGLVYKEFKQHVHVVPADDYMRICKKFPNRYRLSEGIDPHSRTPHHWVRFMYDRYEDTIYVVDELKAPNESMIIADYARLIRAKRQGYAPEYCQIDTSSMVPDVIQRSASLTEEQPESNNIRTEFHRNGISTILVEKDNAIGIGAVKDRLKQVKTIDGVVKKKPKIFVYDTCRGVIREFGLYCWDSFSSNITAERKEQINKVKKKDDHYMDIVKYEAIKRLRSKGHDLEESSKYANLDEVNGSGYD